MRKIIRYIPNFITCLNLFSGCLACVMAFNGNFLMAAAFIYLSAIFDFLDGFAARVLKAYSTIGKELDSLADSISFGLAPGVIMFSLLQEVSFQGISPSLVAYIPYLAFIIPVFSALRLAIFNKDERQISSFIGLPTPANTIFMASLACSLPSVFREYGILLVFVILLFSYLLVSQLPMFSLKFKNLKWQDNALRFIFIALSALVLIIFSIKSLHWVIVLYILMSVGICLVNRKNQNK